MRRKGMFVIFIIALGVIGTAGYLGFRANPQQKTAESIIPKTIAVKIGDVNKTVIAPGELIWTNIVHLTIGASGQVASVNVRPGETAEGGEVLITLGNQMQLEATVADAKVAWLEAQQATNALTENAPVTLAQTWRRVVDAQKALEEAQYHLRGLDNPASQLQIEKAYANVVIMQKLMDQAYKNYQPYQNKPEDNLKRAKYLSDYVSAKETFDTAVARFNALSGSVNPTRRSQVEAELGVAEAELAAAKLHYESLVNGVDPDQLARAEAILAQAAAHLSVAEQQLKSVTLTAPFDGVVLEVNVEVGETVQAGQSVIELSDPFALEVVVKAIEEDLPLIELGQPVELYFDALPEVNAFGQVARIVPKRIPGERPLFNVYIQFDQIPEGLVAGMTADASITIAFRGDVLVIPRSLVQSDENGEAVIEVWENGQLEERVIQTGLRGDVYIEITQGLDVEDQVVLK